MTRKQAEQRIAEYRKAAPNAPADTWQIEYVPATKWSRAEYTVTKKRVSLRNR
jgi:hypothetical protein